MGDTTSFRRGLTLLTALGSEGAVAAGGYGVTKLSEVCKIDKAQASRMLAALADADLVERDSSTRAYRLGWGLFALAARAGEPRLLELAPALLRRLVADIGERSHLSVLRGRDVVTVLTESAPSAVQTAGWIGRPVPAHCTSSGRALLLDLDLPDLLALLDGVSFEANGRSCPADPSDLHARIVAARAHGYTISDEEFEVGLVAAAAPVRDARGQIVAALNVSAPKFRLGDRLPHAAAQIKAAADDLSRQLGWVAASVATGPTT